MNKNRNEVDNLLLAIYTSSGWNTSWKLFRNHKRWIFLSANNNTADEGSRIQSVSSLQERAELPWLIIKYNQ